MAAPAPPVTLPPEPPRRSVGGTIAWAIVVSLVVWGIVATDLRVGDLLRGSDNMASMVMGSTGPTGRFLPGFLPPDFTMWSIYVEQMVITMHMAIWGTLLALLTANPFGLMSATNLAPWWIYQPVGLVLDTVVPDEAHGARGLRHEVGLTVIGRLRPPTVGWVDLR